MNQISLSHPMTQVEILVPSVNLHLRNLFIHPCKTRLRSYLGYPPVRDTQPNTTHFALAALQYTSHVSRLITQVSVRIIYYRLVHLHPSSECRWFPSESHPTIIASWSTLFSH